MIRQTASLAAMAALTLVGPETGPIYPRAARRSKSTTARQKRAVTKKIASAKSQRIARKRTRKAAK